MSLKAYIKDAVLKSRWRFYAAAIGFTLVLAPLYNLFTFQSSIEVKGGLGSSGLVGYGLLAVFASLLYGPLATLLGRKNCLVFGEVFPLIYTLTLFHARLWTLLPAGVLAGMADSVITPALAGIIISLPKSENEISDDTQRKNSRIGFYLGVRSLGRILVNVMPELILKDSGVLQRNSSISNERGNLINISDCGANDCPMNYAFRHNSNIFGRLIPTKDSLYVYLAIICAAQTLGIFLHWVTIPNDKRIINYHGEQQPLLTKDGNRCSELKVSFARLLHHMKTRNRWLALPISLQHGLFLGFLMSEIGRAYVSCTVGVENLGFFLILLYTCAFLANIVWNKFGSPDYLPVLFIVGFGMEISVYVVGLLWQPSHNVLYVLYLLVAMAGMTSTLRRMSTHLVSINYFEDIDSAYLLQTALIGLGNAIVYAWSDVLCVYVKIYILISLSIFSTGSILIAHYRHRKSLTTN